MHPKPTYQIQQDGITTGSKLLDCGCGVGGPMRNIARFTGANVTGITINQYQVKRITDADICGCNVIRARTLLT